MLGRVLCFCVALGTATGLDRGAGYIRLVLREELLGYRFLPRTLSGGAGGGVANTSSRQDRKKGGR